VKVAWQPAMRLFLFSQQVHAGGLGVYDFVKLIIFDVPLSILLHANDSIRNIHLLTATG